MTVLDTTYSYGLGTSRRVLIIGELLKRYQEIQLASIRGAEEPPDHSRSPTVASDARVWGVPA
jgi:hypothetical protein